MQPGPVSLQAQHRGRLAAGLLLARMADPHRPPQRLDVPARLMVRESTLPVTTRTGSAARTRSTS